MSFPLSGRAIDPPIRVVVSGGTGLIGSTLVAQMRADGHDVRCLTRTPVRDGRDLSWDPERGTLDAAQLEGLDAVVNLAGEPIGRRWSHERKRRIRDSRVLGTGLLARALADLANPPKVFATGSAVGFYGDRGNDELDESSPAGSDFLGSVTAEWEAAAAAANTRGIRVVLLRTGIVLTAAGGALGKMLLPFRLGLGGRLGGGQQWVSWIALEDEVRAIRFVLGDTRLEGPVNLVAPNPVRNAELARTLGRVLGRPAVAPAPAALLKLLFGEMAEDTVLASQLVRPLKLVGAGFTFRHSTLEHALRSELGR
jgi:uncharacterized protein (TIGR01777 family)